MAVVKDRKTGIITSIKRFSGNPHDSKTLEESLAQGERVRKSVGGTRPQKAITDRGFRGIKEVEGTSILLPAKKGKTKICSASCKIKIPGKSSNRTLYLPFKKKPLFRVKLPLKE